MQLVIVDTCIAYVQLVTTKARVKM